MKFKKTNNLSSPYINTTSLLDVVFILLLFFAVSTSFLFVGTIRVDLPKATTGVDEHKKEAVNVIVTKDGKLFVNDVQVTEVNLESALKEAHGKTPDASIVIEADANSLHGLVVKVIDAGKLAGFEKFAIATDDPEHKK